MRSFCLKFQFQKKNGLEMTNSMLHSVLNLFFR